MKDKLLKIGIQNIEDLMKITNKKRRMCQDVWYGHRDMSKSMALVIKKKTGASLDFLLS
jgi:hypothetical protein